MNIVAAVAAAWLEALGATAEAGERILRTEIVVDGPVEQVWRAWATEEGVRTFFAPGSRIEPRVDGAYEILFFPEAPPGRRGAEGARLLVLEPPTRIAFTWDAPPHLPRIRGQRTIVYVDLARMDERRTRLRFTHLGWGRGADWDQAYEYFDHAWSAVVLPRLRERFARGPIDWARVPKLAPVARTLKAELTDGR
jgi:uncharacterized protein YndB with AHSA1/START domain